MSHNKITVAGQSPNSSGNISIDSLNINDLGDVTISSASNTQVLKYNGSAWVNSAVGSATSEYILVGQGESNAYSNSGASSLAANQKLRIYDTNPKNTITGASFNKYSSTDWIESITLPTGKYQVISQFNVAFSASGYAACCIEDSSNVNKTYKAVIGDNANSHQEGAATSIVGYFELSSSTTIHLEIKNTSNIDTVANQGNTISEQTFILLIKIG